MLTDRQISYSDVFFKIVISSRDDMRFSRLPWRLWTFSVIISCF